MRMRRRFAWETILAIAVVAIGSQYSLQAALTEELHKMFPLEADGRVSVGNVNGSVRISAWDRNEVQVDAVKRAHTQEALDEARIVIDSSSGSISIRTKYPESHRHRDAAGVEYTLKVPRRARLWAIDTVNGGVEVSGVSGDVKISSVNGPVTAKNLAADARLTTVNGTVDATFEKLQSAASVSIDTVNGRIVLSLPDSSNGELDANTVHGGITSDFGVSARRSLKGRIGSGSGAHIKLNTVNGGIQILSTADGRRVLHT
jgi:DUF4097 and DUF4098 domain-containing protein YvlB